MQPLTLREKEVCELFAAGTTYKEVASILHISANTVEAHTHNAFRKLGVHSIRELLATYGGKTIAFVPYEQSDRIEMLLLRVEALLTKQQL